MKKIIYGIAAIGVNVCTLAAQTSADTTMSRTIQDVEIWGRHSAGILGGAIKQLQIENNPSSVNVTAADAFRQFPSVITDIEGGVLFRGSTKTGMFIDGVPYGLMEEYSGDVLIQLPAIFFNHLSLSAFAPIDFVPDGDAGVLDLSSQIATGDSSPLTLHLGGGLHNRYNVGAVLNLNPGRFHIVAKYNYRREFRSRKFDKSTTTSQNTTIMNNNADARPNIHLADLAISYDLTENDELGVKGLFHSMSYSRYGRINNQIYKPNGEMMKHVIRNRYNNQRQNAYSAEVWWKHLFQNGGTLSARFNYNDFLYDEDNDFKNENPQNGMIVAEDNQFINHDKHNYFWKIHYRHPFAEKLFLHAGYIGRLTQETYTNEVNNKQEEIWQANPAKSYRYEFTRNLNLFFLSLAKKAEVWEGEIGLQAEVGRREMKEADQVTTKAFHLYPQARLVYHLTDEQQLALSYQQRVIRPLGSELNSYVDNSDATHIFKGNPDLKDEYVHSVELSYQLGISNFRLRPALYFRSRTNRIVEVAEQMSEETIWQKVNAGISRSAGADLSMRWQPLQVLTLGASGNVFRDEIDGRTIGYGEKKSLWCWDVKGSAEWFITPTTHLQIDGFYVSDQLTPQGKVKSRYVVNAGLSQYFLQKRLCASLSVHNLFDSLEETTLISTPNMQMEQIRNRDARVSWLTLTYKF